MTNGTFGAVINWLAQFDNVVDKNQLKAELRICHDDDGFKFCEHLSKMYQWEPNAELVAILDGTEQEDFT